MGLERSATRNAGRPGTGRRAGSNVTGPGPLAGGRNSWPAAIQPVVLSGAKLGTDWSAALAGQSELAMTNAIDAVVFKISVIVPPSDAISRRRRPCLESRSGA